MSTGTDGLLQRLTAVEARVARLETEVAPPSRPALTLPLPPQPQTTPPVPRVPTAVSAEPAPSARRVDIEELLGGRVLGLVGGGAVVLAAVFFLGLAVERGWIGPAVRTAVAAAVSAVLVGVGTWLHERRGRTQAALMTAAAGIGGLLLSAVAATPGYGLVPVAVTLPAAVGVGALGTALALRWDAKPVAWLGIGGGLLAPALLDAPASAVTLAFLVAAYAAAATVAVARRWHDLLVGAFLLVLPQVGWWAVQGPEAVALALALAAVGAVPLLAAVVSARGAQRAADLTVPVLLVGAAGWWLLVLGTAGLPAAAHPWWLATVALATGAVLAAALAPRLGGGTAAVRDLARGGTTTLAAALLLGVGVLWSSSGEGAGPPPDLLDAAARLSVLTAITAAAAGLELLGRRVVPSGDGTRPSEGVDALAVLSLAVVTVGMLSGWLLLAVLAVETLAMRLLAVRTGDRTAQVGAAALWVVALLEALSRSAPLTALVDGLDDVPAAVGGMAVVVGTAAAAAAFAPADRQRWAAAAAGAVGYLASTLLVTGGLALGGEQWAQVLLGTAWTLAGAALLSLGLRQQRRSLRLGGFALLGLAVSKAVLYDLSALDLGERAASFLALGLLLLAAGFGYQRRRDRTA